MLVKAIVTPAAAAFELHCRARTLLRQRRSATKKFFGRATGNTRLRTEERVDQCKGNTKQAGAKVKDAFKH